MMCLLLKIKDNAEHILHTVSPYYVNMYLEKTVVFYQTYISFEVNHVQ